MNPRRIWSLGCSAFLLASLWEFAAPVAAISISAAAFAPGEPMPAKYAYKGQNISPELRIANVPANARSLVLIVDDPDSPSGLWTHWLLWNVRADTTSLVEGVKFSKPMEGKNSFGHVRYDGPAPPSGTHRYFFHLYALDTSLFLPAGSSRTTLEKAMNGHIVGTGETFGVYSAQ